MPKALAILILGTGIVSIFSDPMVDVINTFGAWWDGVLSSTLVGVFTLFVRGSSFLHSFHTFVPFYAHIGNTINVPSFYVSFLITPFCSNASEVISSLIFLSRKKKVNASLSYAQLYVCCVACARAVFLVWLRFISLSLIFRLLCACRL